MIGKCSSYVARCVLSDFDGAAALLPSARRVKSEKCWKIRLGMHRLGATRLAPSPSSYGTPKTTLAAAIDLAKAAVSIQIDNQVALTGLQAHRGQDTDHPIIFAASAALRVVRYATNVRAIHIQAV